MVVTAIALYVLWLIIAFGWRSWKHRKVTGDFGYRGFREPVNSAGWWGGLLFGAALVLSAVGLTGALTWAEPIRMLDAPAFSWLGLVLAVGGLLVTPLAQGSMGRSWRIGVDHDERTALVTKGAFAIVRNPIFSACLLTSAGLALMVPNIVTIGAFVCLLAAIELQVRAVEEPYLSSVHGSAYDDYRAQVGRLIPRIGLIRRSRVS